MPLIGIGQIPVQEVKKGNNDIIENFMNDF